MTLRSLKCRGLRASSRAPLSTRSVMGSSDVTELAPSGVSSSTSTRIGVSLAKPMRSATSATSVAMRAASYSTMVKESGATVTLAIGPVADGAGAGDAAGGHHQLLEAALVVGGTLDVG